jgi:hypothetical protein
MLMVTLFEGLLSKVWILLYWQGSEAFEVKEHP